MSIKLSPTLPDPDTTYNGLPGIHELLVANPKQRILVVGTLDVLRIATEIASGSKTPTVRFSQIEPVLPPDGVLDGLITIDNQDGQPMDVWAHELAQTLLDQLHQKRTGRAPLF